ncbi:MAG: Trp biosynthesis-associated membrane protein [Microbacteriaceae bacterium]|nr:Trp biosynthesis-associated membrane protein [Microbacteriaceae bacterium]
MLSRLTEKKTLLGLALVSGALGLLLASATWVSVTLLDGRQTSATGFEVSALYGIVPITWLALTAALFFAGPVGRRIIGILYLLIAVFGLVAVVQVFVDPVSKVAAKISALTGIAGGDILSVVESISLEASVYATAVLSILMIFIAILILFFSGDWVAKVKKYEISKSFEVSEDSIDTWDAISKGEYQSDQE